MVSAAPVAAAPAVDGIFDIPGDAGVQNNGQLTVGPDGNIWVALDSAVAKVTPDGTVTVFGSTELNDTLGNPTGGITSAGGFIWVSQGVSVGKQTIVKIPPAAPATATGVAVADIDAGATAMTTGPDGNVWVGLTNKIVRFTPTDPPAPIKFEKPLLSPKGMTSASDGTLWVTDTQNGGRLLNVTTGGADTPYIVGGQPQFLAAGPSGQIAFSNPNNAPQQIGLLSPGGTAQLLDRPAGSDPFGVTFGNDGAYWIAEFAGNRLARVTTDGQLTTLAGFPDAPLGTQGPRQITVGPNNTLWATIDKPGDAPNSKIARITGVESPPVTNPGPTPGDQTPTNTPPPPPPPPDTTAPQLSLVTVTRTGTTLRFTLSEAGTARAVLARAAAGKRRGKACVKPTRKLRKAKRCTRFVRVKVVSAPAIAGQNAIRLPKQTRPGRYRVVITATDAAGNRGTPVTRAFTVNKKRK
jgi:streptogramin lyase